MALENPGKIDVQEVTTYAKKALIWLSSTTFVSQLITWALTFLTARILKPSDYGMLAYAETLLPHLALLTSLELTTWVIQRSTFSKEEEQATFTLTSLLGLLGFALGFFFSPLLASFYKNPELTIVFRVLSVIFLFQGLQAVPNAKLRRELRFKPIAIMNLVVNVSRGLLQLILAYYGFSYWALIGGFLYKELLNTIWLFSVSKTRLAFTFHKKLWKEAIFYGAPATLSSFFWIIFSTADNIVIGKLFGQDVLGLYAMAFYLIDLPLSKFNTVVRPILIPYFSRLKTLPQVLFPSFLNIVKGAAAITFPILAGLVLTAPEAVPLLLGEKWLGMIIFIQFLGVIGMIRAVTDNISPFLFALGHPKRVLFYHFITVLILPASFYCLAKNYGMDGIFITWLVIFPLVSLVSVSQLKSVSEITFAAFLKSFKAPLISTLVMFAVLWIFSFIFMAQFSSQLTMLVSKVVLGMISYFLTFFLFFKSDGREIINLTKEI